MYISNKEYAEIWKDFQHVVEMLNMEYDRSTGDDYLSNYCQRLNHKTENFSYCVSAEKDNNGKIFIKFSHNPYYKQKYIQGFEIPTLAKISFNKPAEKIAKEAEKRFIGKAKEAYKKMIEIAELRTNLAMIHEQSKQKLEELNQKFKDNYIYSTRIQGQSEVLITSCYMSLSDYEKFLQWAKDNSIKIS